MLILNPRTVTFGSALWEGIAAVAIDRHAHRLIEEWGDRGSYAVLADVPEQRVRIKIVQEVDRDSVGVPRPGEQGILTLYTAPARSEAGRRRVSATAVVLAVEHEVSTRRGALRTVVLAAVSDGAGDPITVSDASGGEV
jgi:hypothetical protein